MSNKITFQGRQQDNTIKLPPDPPEGFGWALGRDGIWTLEKCEPAPSFDIMVGDRFHCGYGDRESAERFLPSYQGQYPDETVSIKETVSQRFLTEEEQ